MESELTKKGLVVSRRRSSSGSGLAVLIVAVLALLSQIPKEVWIVILVAAVVAVVVYVIMQNSNKETTATDDLSSSFTASLNLGSDRPSPRSVKTEGVRGTVATPAFERRIPAPSADELARARWLAREETFDLGGLHIAGGMVYVGLNLRADHGRQEPALINPNLRVSRETVDISVRRMPYWPSYSEIDPEARRAYLQWLASGRRDPSADVGYVFLFFYGLERRALVDSRQGQVDASEFAVIRGEVEELLSVYGQNASFRSYATSFLDYLAVASATPEALVFSEPPNQARGYELPLRFRIGLGQFAKAKKPVPCSWAMKWALADPSIVCRTPVQRCRREFERLFPEYYQQQFGEGLLLPLNKTKLKVTYRPASGGFAGGILSCDPGDLPDIAAIAGPQKKIQSVIDICTAELDRYSRFLAKNAERKDQLEAILLLPIPAWPESLQSSLAEVVQEVEAGEITATWGGLIKRFGSDATLTRSSGALLAARLEERGIGIEPDLIGGAKTPTAEDAIVVFSCPKRNEKLIASGAFTTAVLTVDVGALMAAADGDTSESEFRLLRQTIDSWQQLDEHCRRRLAAHLQLQITQAPAIAGVKKRVEMLSVESRRTLADVLISVARADGNVSPNEVKLLEKLYKVLELDPKLVYSDLHKGATAVRQTKPEFALNTTRIARLQEETERISSVLREVFTEATPQPAAAIGDGEGENIETLLGLDPEHSSFARLLLSRPQWSRHDLEDAASDMELMLDGALEKVNEAALDQYEVPLAEGEDPVEINRDLLERVFA